MSATLPDNIIKHYGSARAFKTDKRRLLRAIRILANDFYAASAYLPDEAHDAARDFRANLKALEDLCSERKWGR